MFPPYSGCGNLHVAEAGALQWPRKQNPQRSSKRPEVQIIIKEHSLRNKKPFYVKIYIIFTKTSNPSPDSSF